MNEEDIFQEFEHVKLDTPYISPTSGMLITHIANPKKENDE